jgi:lipopolysaccharide export system protein LptC
MRNLFRLALVGMIGVAIWTTYLSYYQAPTLTQITSTLPDAFMEGVTALVMNKDGQPSLKIVTPRLVHFAVGDTTNFVDPKVTLYRKSPEPWLITSLYAKATHGITDVNFWDNVKINHAQDINSPETTIKTPSLLVHPNDRTAETNDVITLIQPNTMVQAVGMRANMNTGDIKLLSRARGEYVPDS